MNVNPDGNGIKWENSRFFYGSRVENETLLIQDEVAKNPICQVIAELNQIDRFKSFSSERFRTPDVGTLNVDYKQSVSMTFEFPT